MVLIVQEDFVQIIVDVFGVQNKLKIISVIFIQIIENLIFQTIENLKVLGNVNNVI